MAIECLPVNRFPGQRSAKACFFSSLSISISGYFPHFPCWQFYSSNCSWQRVGYLFLTRINKIIWSDCLFFLLCECIVYAWPLLFGPSTPKTGDNANAYYPIVIQTFSSLFFGGGVFVAWFAFWKTVTIRYNYDATEWQRALSIGNLKFTKDVRKR